MALPLAATVLAGCAHEASDDEAATAPIVGVKETTLERPEIGRFDNCTGTLVAPNVVLSAAHCFDYRSQKGELGRFFIERPDPAKPGSVVRTGTMAVEVIVYGKKTGDDDLALVKLAESVASDVATPAKLASKLPPQEERVAMWGYGCTARTIPPNLFRDGGGTVVVTAAGEAENGKRKYEYPASERTNRGCPGDSGGPRTRASGEIFAVNSAFFQDRDIPLEGPDTNADVVKHYETFVAQIAAWR